LARTARFLFSDQDHRLFSSFWCLLNFFCSAKVEDDHERERAQAHSSPAPEAASSLKTRIKSEEKGTPVSSVVDEQATAAMIPGPPLLAKGASDRRRFDLNDSF
jgi:hypothetical protein